MRRLLTFAVLAALLLPAAATARQRGANDGTMSVKDARGTVTIQGHGAVIGSFAQGRVTITDPIDGDGLGPVVTGDEWSKDRSDTTTTWGGTKVRFRMIGGTFKIVVKGRGINLSFVGIGNGGLQGARSEADGTYATHGAQYGSSPRF